MKAITLHRVVEELGLEVRAGKENLGREVSGGYACDLLSDVMAHAEEGNIWVTTQAHQNIVAVATLVGLSGVVVTGGATIEPEAIEKADREGIPLLATKLPTFEVVGRLYALGVRGGWRD